MERIMMRGKLFTVLVFILAIGLLGCASTSLYHASSDGDFDVARGLIEDGASVDERGVSGQTPLMAAAQIGDTKIIQMLVFNGADVNLKDDFGKSALQYAFDNENTDAFKILLENGAKVDFAFSKKSVTPGRKRIISLAGEYREYMKIKNSRSGNLSLFANYFGNYGKGVYYRDVIMRLRQMVQRDYKRIERAGSASQVEGFIRKYSNLGADCYIVTAGVLNIREDNSTKARTVGKYRKGDMVCAQAEQYGWIKTGRGWISKTYTRKAKYDIPALKPFIEKASRKLQLMKRGRPVVKTKSPAVRKPAKKIPPKRKSAKTVAEKAKPAKTKPKPAPEPAVPGPARIDTPVIDDPARPDDPDMADYGDEDPVVAARNELDEILKNASKEKLRAFLRKYKDSVEHAVIVREARNAYIRIINEE